jgi:hypothetical protein
MVPRAVAMMVIDDVLELQLVVKQGDPGLAGGEWITNAGSAMVTGGLDGADDAIVVRGNARIAKVMRQCVFWSALPIYTSF